VCWMPAIRLPSVCTTMQRPGLACTVEVVTRSRVTTHLFHASMALWYAVVAAAYASDTTTLAHVHTCCHRLLVQRPCMGVQPGHTVCEEDRRHTGDALSTPGQRQADALAAVLLVTATQRHMHGTTNYSYGIARCSLEELEENTYTKLARTDTTGARDDIHARLNDHT
jgi:hypothetical protein